jgi:hypothetical protein
VPIEVDTTGTYVWLAVSCVGLGQDVTVTTGIDALDGGVLATMSGDAVQLSYDDGTRRDEAWALATQLVDPATADELVGQTVTLWAEASGCGRSARGSATTTISGYDTNVCQGCLAEACLPELAVCGADCIAIQACLDSYCVNLSASASPDEVTCQAYCQGLHPNGKQAHVAVASCVEASMCQPPCNGYSIDYDACQGAVNTGTCATASAACMASSDCQAFKACTSGCTSWSACEACGKSHPSGEMLFEAYNECVEGICLTLGWLPHLSE